MSENGGKKEKGNEREEKCWKRVKRQVVKAWEV